MFYLDELFFLSQDNVTFNDKYIENVSIDSRTVKVNGLYIPITGETNNGHDFILEAISNGAIAAIWDKTMDIPNDVPHDFELILVDSTFDALHDIAKFYKEKINPIMIGITGSNGKTTTKDIAYHIISKSYFSHKTPGNLNNHYGVPLTILTMPVNTQVCIVELGMSGFGEIEKLSRLVNPEYAVITNIGDSHLRQLKTRENIAKAKLEIRLGMNNKGILIFDGDEHLLRKTHGIPIGLYKGESRLGIVQKEDRYTLFSFRGNSYKIPLLGEHNVKNAAFAIEIATRLNIDSYDIKQRLESLLVSNMRMQRIEGENGSTLINDAYNASPTSMKASIETLNSLKGYTNKVLVVGDMLELGPDEEKLHKEIAKFIGPTIRHVITIGSRAKWIAEGVHKLQLPIKVDEVDSSEEAATIIKPFLSEETVVLTKASRGMHLEDVIFLLQKEGK